MLKKPKKRSAKPSLETGKTLPSRVSSYSPSHRRQAMPEVAEPKQPKRIWLRVILLMMLLIIGAALIIGVWDARNISAASSKLFGDGNIFSLMKGGGLSTADNGRVNILIAGYS